MGGDINEEDEVDVPIVMVTSMHTPRSLCVQVTPGTRRESQDLHSDLLMLGSLQGGGGGGGG